MLEENFQHVSKVSSNYFTAPVFIFHFLLKTCLVLSAHVETRVPLWFCLKVHILPTVRLFFLFCSSWCLLLPLNSQVWSHIYFIEIDKTLQSMAYSSLSHGYMFVLAVTSFNLGIERKGSAHLGQWCAIFWITANNDPCCVGDASTQEDWAVGWKI